MMPFQSSKKSSRCWHKKWGKPTWQFRSVKEELLSQRHLLSIQLAGQRFWWVLKTWRALEMFLRNVFFSRAVPSKVEIRGKRLCQPRWRRLLICHFHYL